MTRSTSEFYAPRVLLLCFWGGVLGIHRFYVGKVFTGVLQLITLGGFGIWWIIDMCMIGSGNVTDNEGNSLQGN